MNYNLINKELRLKQLKRMEPNELREDVANNRNLKLLEEEKEEQEPKIEDNVRQLPTDFGRLAVFGAN